MRSEIAEMSLRIARLERANRRLKVIGLALALVLLALTAMASGRKPRTIEAEKIVVLDGHGRPRIVLGTPAVAGAAVDMDRDEPAIWLTDGGGTDRTIATSDGFYLADNRVKKLISITGGPGRPRLQMYGTDGAVLWSAP
jgi:hypothetical protein